ncbi:MAG: methionine--tRNA ligase [archaeon]
MIPFKKYYVTTPIYYPNDVPHIGHAYTTIAADVLARWARLKGADTFFLTGTDEHGEKIQEAANAREQEPKEFCDELVEHFKDAWSKLNISYDQFIRTTDPDHEKIVNEIIRKCFKNKDIYLGEYEDWYCVPCETFWTETQLSHGKCPDCNREVKKLKEETYFFKLSKYQKPLLDFYEKNPEFISPEGKRQEIINRVKDGLNDLSITRTKLKWGIPFPLDNKHVTYVWFDALVNYISGLKKGRKYAELWPPDVHLVGKDILWFHTVIWPAMLLSAGVKDLPKKVFGHGWWTVEGDKISKSKGNAITVEELYTSYGADRTRFALLKAMPFGADGDFSRKDVAQLINSELADNVGNFVHRVLILINKLSDGKVPGAEIDPAGKKVLSEIRKVSESVDKKIEQLKFYEALQETLNLARLGNQYLNEKEPWKSKDLGSIRVCATLIRSLAVLFWPFIPETSEKIWEQLGEKDKIDKKGWKAALEEVAPDQAIGTPSPLIEKIEYKEPELKFSGKKIVLDKEIQKLFEKGDVTCSIAEVIGFKVQRRSGPVERLKKKIISEFDEQKVLKTISAYSYLLDEKRDCGTEGLSSENIVEFTRNTGQVPNINTVTDIYNLVSFKTGLIMGAYDLAKIKGNVNLRVAKGDENFVPIGTKEAVKIEPTEWVLADDANKVLTRWLTKEHDNVKIEKGATSCIVCVQGSKNIPQKEVNDAITEICELITAHCGGKYKILLP